MEEKRREEETEGGLSRRHFIEGVALAGAVLAACGTPRETVTREKMTPGPATAPEGRPLRAGLVGCGGRGTGAARDFLRAGPGLELTALADVFQDRLDRCRQRLAERMDVEVPDENCFVGFDAFQKLVESDVDIVLLATPPHFRPQHFQAAVEARKHVFMEKPVAVDATGVRSVIETAEKADAFGLSVGTGTQFRHQKSFIETYNRIAEGAIGQIVAARAYSLRGQLWYREPQPEWSEMEAMLRDWVNWQWLSGDFIVEQHIHGLDVINWFTGEYPVKAVAMGGRARRVTGDQYDYFAVDYELESGVHVHSLSRQVDGCTNNISRWVIGTQGYTNCQDSIFSLDGQLVWKYGGISEPSEDAAETGTEDNSPYVQEHIDLVTSIRTEKPVNEAVNTAYSTLTAIMGRDSAYSGLEVTREELMQSPQRLGPTEYALGPVGIEAVAPVPGVQEQSSR